MGGGKDGGKIKEKDEKQRGKEKYKRSQLDYNYLLYMYM